MAVTDGSGNIQMHGIGSPEPMEILDEYVLVANEDLSMTRMDRLGHENEMLKTLLSDLHKYVTSHLEINDSAFERELKADPLSNLSQQAQDIYQFLKTTKEKERHMDRLGNENEILKTLLSDLHKYVTSHMEINDSPFELSSALRPDPPVANLYKQAQDVYYFLKEAKEIESEMAYVDKQLFELLSIIIGDGDHHKTCSTGRERGTKDVSLSLLQQRDSQKERFQRALYLLEQMKGTQKHMDRLRNENEILKTVLSDLHRYVTSHAEINDSPFELSSAIEPDPPVANLYRQAQDVYHFLKDTKERERECGKMHTKIIGLEQSLAEKEMELETLSKAWQCAYKKLQEENAKDLEIKHKEWVRHCMSLTQQHEKEKEQLHNTLERLNSEKDNLLTRLSVIAADRLTHGNVNIADLSDPNRPTKLQEVYSELYDNEWTDAYQELTEHPNVSDKDAIRILLDILMCSFHRCREITWDRYEKLRCVASSVEIVKINPLLSDVKVVSDVSEHGLAKEESASTVQLGKTDITVNQRFGYTLDLDINLEKQIKDIWRTTNVALKEHVIKQLPSIIEAFLDLPWSILPMTSKYLGLCIELCWNMGIQEKPLHLDNVFEKRFDKEKFKTYTHSGENVEFVVWPALFLYEGGPILAKGIAQGCSGDRM